MKTLNQVISDALVERGWKLDPSATENMGGEVKEFLHPKTGEAFAWLDAVLIHQEQFEL